MKDYVICGIQQIGIGVKDLRESWKWYISQFGMDCRIFEDESEARLMLPYTGGQPRSRHAVLALNLQSGGGFEIWQYKGREPVPFNGEPGIGDYGILVCKMKVKNIEAAYSFYKSNATALPGEPKTGPDGTKSFFVRDPYGNNFQMLERHGWFMNENKISGGSYGAIIGVSDIDKSLPVYSDILGYDEIAYDKTGTFPDLTVLPGGTAEIRRVLLRRTLPEAGPFSRLFGKSEIELVSVPGKKGRKVLEGRFWGDLGFIHLCFDIRNMDVLKTKCEETGFPFSVDSKKSHDGNSFDMGEAAGHFAYIEDPDGTLIEFVESHKIPLIKKLNWYLDLQKRDSYKPLPDWMVKTLRFSRVKH